MSTPEPAPNLEKSTSKQGSRSTKDQEELEKLDVICNRLKRVVPNAPYILSVPSLDPYNYHSRHEAHSWMIGHLFEPNEEHLQYRTYFYREPYVNCFVIQSGEEADPEPVVEKPKPKPLSAASQGPTKKISLSDYRAGRINGVVTPGSKKPSPDLTPTKTSHTQPNGVKPSLKKVDSSASKPVDLQSRKRPLDEMKSSRETDGASRQDQPSAKKLRKDPSPVSKIDKSVPSNSTPHGLPPLLSPVRTSLPQPYDLPPILSPTLPTNVQEELMRLETEQKRDESTASNSSSKSQLLAVPDPTNHRRDDASKEKAHPTNRIRSVSIGSVGSKSPGISSQMRRETMESAHDHKVEKLVVKLKYGKKNCTRVSKLLRLPTSRKAPVIIEKKDREEPLKESSTKALAKNAESIAAKAKERVLAQRAEASISSSKSDGKAQSKAEKRARGDDDTAPSKKQKSQATHDAPRTPAEQVTVSPALSNRSSAQKSQYATPKDIKTINMIRTNSTESFDNTPGRSGTTPSSASKHLDVKGGPTSAPDASRLAEAPNWSRLSNKLNTLGRSLKHEAQNLYKERGSQMSEEVRKRVAVIAIECILTYITAFHANDLDLVLRRKPIDVEATWKTLLPMSHQFGHYTRGFPHLDGLRLHLRTIVSSRISEVVSKRSVRANPQHDSPQDTPGTDPVTNLRLLSEMVMNSRDWSAEARFLLPIEDLMGEFPKTWEGRETKKKPVRGLEQSPVGNLNGPYYLPLSFDTTPIQVARFGRRLLREFCEKETIDYRIRLSFEKPA